jgi:hypothetical protein
MMHRGALAILARQGADDLESPRREAARASHDFPGCDSSLYSKPRTSLELPNFD